MPWSRFQLGNVWPPNGWSRLVKQVFRQRSQPRPDVLHLVTEVQTYAPDDSERLFTLLRDGLKESTEEYRRYQVAEALTAAVYPKYKFSEYARIFLEDEEFLEYYRRFMDPDNWHSLDRKYTLRELLKLCIHLDGDAVECGTYRGMSAYLICKAYKGSGRRVHLFDSFEGLPTPQDVDGTYWSKGDLNAPEQATRETLAEFDNYVIHKGWIPDKFSDIADRRFAFAHIDVDLYEPTLASLEFLYPRMVTGGLILLDDHGFKTCPGAKLAADRFFLDRPEQIILLPTGQAFVIKQ